MSNAEKIQAVMNTLAILEMPSTYENVNKMLGIYNTLKEVSDDLWKQQEEQKKQQKPKEAETNGRKADAK